jgi:hypothetical protein
MELHEAGASVTEIAAELGCGKSGVSKVLRSLELNAKPAAVISDPELLVLLTRLYEKIWALKRNGFPGAPPRLLLERLKMLIAVVKE